MDIRNVQQLLIQQYLNSSASLIPYCLSPNDLHTNFYTFWTYEAEGNSCSIWAWPVALPMGSCEPFVVWVLLVACSINMPNLKTFYHSYRVIGHY